METLLDSLVVAIRADTRDLGRGLRGVREDLNGIANLSDLFGDAGELAADRMSRAFERFAQTGKLSFAELKASVLASLNEIASAVIRSGLQELLGGVFGQSSGPLGGLLGGGIAGGGFGGGGFGGLLSLAGRAIGGPVREDRPFLVGERGPEVFMPNRAGRVEPLSASLPARPRSISITVNVNGAGDAPALRQSAGQVAAAVRRAMLRAERDL